MKKFILLGFIAIFTFTNCQNDDKKAKNEMPKQEKTSSKLVWTFNPDASNIKWTGFKTTDKIGVHGEFKQFNIKGIDKDVSLANTIQHALVKVNIFSVFSGNESRDKKLIASLFQKMSSTDMIEGRVLKIDDKNHTADVVFNMNAHEKKVTMSMNVDESKGVIQLKGKIDLIKDFGADEAMAIFHEACKDKHTGKDGISKTWSEVDIEANLKFNK